MDQVLELALCKLRSRMSAVSRLTIVASVAHVQQAFIQLVVTHLISREVHVLAVGQNVVERLFLKQRGEEISNRNIKEIKLTFGMSAFVGYEGDRERDLGLDCSPPLRF